MMSTQSVEGQGFPDSVKRKLFFTDANDGWHQKLIFLWQAAIGRLSGLSFNNHHWLCQDQKNGQQYRI